MRSAAPDGAGQRKRQQTRNCCSTACSCTRRSAEAGRCSSRSPAGRSQRRHFADTPEHPLPDTRNRRENHLLPRPISPYRSPRCFAPARTTSRPPRRRARCAPSSSATTRPRRPIAMSAPCRRGTRWTRRSASAARSRERKVEVGQTVREGDVLAVLDDADYRLAEEAARQQLAAATAQARQAESDRQRLNALKTDGSVSASDDEQAQSRALTTQATAEAQARQLELARNRLEVHGAARIAQRRGHAREIRGRPGRRRRPAGRLDRRRGRARDRRRRARGSARSVQEGAVQGIAARARPTRRSRSCCASFRRRPRRRRARIAPD